MSMLPLFPRVMVEKKENKNTHFWCCCVWLRDVVEHARVCEHRGSQQAVFRAASCEKLRGASAKRWRSAGEANAKRCWKQLARFGSALASARSCDRSVARAVIS